MHNWGTLTGPTYLLLRSPDEIETLEVALPQFVGEQLPTSYSGREYELQRLADIHLDPAVQFGTASTSDPAYVYLLTLLALFVLLLACVNFTTLALGRSVTRVREVGIRKVVGAGRSQLMKQFWGEALVVSLVALVGGLLLAEVMIHVFNDFSGKSLSMPSNPMWLLFLAGLLLCVSLLAGSYPAVYLSKFHPVAVLKGNVAGTGKHRLTHGLIVVQFAVSIFLVISTLFMSKQLDLLTERNLGFDDEQVVRIRSEYGSTWEGRRLFERYKQRLASEPSVSRLTGSMFTFGDPDSQQNVFPIVAGADTVRGHVMNVTPGFVETFGIELVEGRDFSEERPGDVSGAILVNESLVEAFGWDDPIGNRLSTWSGFADAPVVGVVRDFHYESLHQRVDPVVLYLGDDPLWSFYARVGPGSIQEAVAALERAWHDVAPDLPFEVEFVDQAIDRLYRSEMQWAWLIRAGAGIAIFIACLGLLGLAALAAARRRKEIGIRKVLGASAGEIAVLLTKQVVVLVMIALAIATPLGYLAVSRWLTDFAYRIDVTPDVFLLAGALALGIAVLTVSTQAVRAGLSDPVEALRSE